MDSEYPTAPELPRKVPQLVREGKQPEPAEPKVPAETAELLDEEPDEVPDELNEHVEDPGDPDGVVAAQKQKTWQQAYQASASAPKKKKRRWPIILLVVLLLAATGGIAYK